MMHPELVSEGIRRARLLGWRSISTDRLIRLANGDEKALPKTPKGSS